ncbi:response regulator transcription factor [Flavobacterium silvaticum]|uniref:Response regulator transcription factor n=1 Tax=Flavobacterium silvaticum TaxID=1852020 RepID=A0A972FK07_9FLAO|nr:response regulator transcription factor [Flavobacterium silvaticum]NMH27459.1 response regulator transcription factor [Flavobacterium silvaticum]
MKLLIVEDEPQLLAIIRKGFSEKNHDVSAALDATTALSLLSQHTFDAVILDVMLPDGNGIAICRDLRKNKNFVPVILLTALGSTENVVNGLDSGADDYMVKPFRFSELEARVNALVRRSSIENHQPDTIVIDDLFIDNRTKKVKRGDDSISLTAKEFRLLHFLAKHRNNVVSREQILDNVWDINFDMNTNVVDVYINYLRKKIDKPYKEPLIHTVKGLGYTLKP